MLAFVLNFIQIAAACALVYALFSDIFDFEFKKSKVPFFVFDGIIVALGVVSSVLIKDESDLDMVKEFFIFLIFVVSPCLLFQKTKRLLRPVLGLTVNATLDYVVFIFLSPLKTESFVVIGVFYCAVYAVIFALFFAYRKKTNKELMRRFFDSISPLFYVVILIADWSAYYDVVLSSDASYYVEISNAIRLISTVMLLGGLFYIVNKFTQSMNKEKEAELQVDMQMKLYSEMMKKNRDIREFRHDYKNNLFSIGAFIDNGRYSEAKDYIKGLNVSLEATKNRFATGNYLADAILADKADHAAEYDIEIEFAGTIPEKGIANNDLCTVLANSLDNAIRGCQPCAPCRITVDSKENSVGVIIVIRNPVRQKVEIVNNHVKTTKTDKENHGIGIQNIKKTAAKYGGYVELKCDDYFFETEIGLYFKNKEELQ